MSIGAVTASTPEPMSDLRIREFLTDRGVGVLGLADGGTPYLIPMSSGYDGGDALSFPYLLFGPESRKQELSDRAEKARFLVYHARSVHSWRSVSIVGSVDPVAGDERDSLRGAMENAWHPDLFTAASLMRGVAGYRLAIDDWTGLHRTSGTDE